MRYTYRFRLDPTPEQRELLDQHRDTCRQLYNHALTEFEKIPESAGTLTHRVRQVRDQLTDLEYAKYAISSPILKSGGMN